MKIIKIIFFAIFDPIGTVISKSFPEFAYKVLNKNVLIQVLIAFIITLVVMLVGR